MKKYLLKKRNIFLLLVVLFTCFIAINFEANAASSVQSSYDKYKLELIDLQESDKKSQFRHNWLRLADKFYSLYEENTKWPNRPAALFRAAEAYDGLAKKSYAAIDRNKAIELYNKVIKDFPISVLADDSLYNLAIIYSEQLKNSEKASELLAIITEKYKKADHYTKAKEYEKKLDASLTASIDISVNNIPKIQTNDTIYEGMYAYRKKDYIELKVELDSKDRKNSRLAWSIDYISPQKKTKSPARLILTMNKTRSAPEIRAGYKYQSMAFISKFVVDFSKRNATVIVIDFKKLDAYYAFYDEENDCIRIHVTDKAKNLAKGIKTKDLTSSYTLPKVVIPRDFSKKIGFNVRTIVIDPGHGGKDQGSAHNGIIEKDLVLEVSKMLGSELRKLGYKVVYTRTEDVFYTLSRRAKIAKQKKGDLFISVHANGAENKHLAGIETYYLDYRNSPSGNHANEEFTKSNVDSMVDELALKVRKYESERLASFVHRDAYGHVSSKGYTVKNGGTKGAAFAVLDKTTMPAVLLEIGYLSNALDIKNLKNKGYLNSVAKGVAKGIHSYAQDLTLAKK